MEKLSKDFLTAISELKIRKPQEECQQTVMLAFFISKDTATSDVSSKWDNLELDIRID